MTEQRSSMRAHPTDLLDVRVGRGLPALPAAPAGQAVREPSGGLSTGGAGTTTDDTPR